MAHPTTSTRPPLRAIDLGAYPSFHCEVPVLLGDLLSSSRAVPHLRGCQLIRGRPVRRVELVAHVVARHLGDRSMSLLLDDGTGTIQAMVNVCSDEAESHATKDPGVLMLRQAIALGALVRVTGRLNESARGLEVLVDHIRHVKHVNEEWEHWERVMHLFNTKLPQDDAVLGYGR